MSLCLYVFCAGHASVLSLQPFTHAARGAARGHRPELMPLRQRTSPPLAQRAPCHVTMYSRGMFLNRIGATLHVSWGSIHKAIARYAVIEAPGASVRPPLNAAGIRTRMLQNHDNAGSKTAPGAVRDALQNRARPDGRRGAGPAAPAAHFCATNRSAANRRKRAAYEAGSVTEMADPSRTTLFTRCSARLRRL